MRDDLDQLLKNLHLGRMAEILDREIAQAREHHASYEDFLGGLLRARRLSRAVMVCCGVVSFSLPPVITSTAWSRS